jgi:nicotinate-nucleotide adenylyltransferase
LYIGLYGGTFNPIHFGHLRTGEEIRQWFKMKEIVFIPSCLPPHKDTKDIVEPIHRLKMVSLAVTGNPNFSASDVELYRRGKSYTFDTIRELKVLRPDDQFAFIMGLDAFLEIETWYKFREIFAECDFIVTSRPGGQKVSCLQAIPPSLRDAFKRKGTSSEFVHESGKHLFFHDVTDLNISATSIRTLVRAGLSARYLLPRRVMDYIHEHQLYQ